MIRKQMKIPLDNRAIARYNKVIRAASHDRLIQRKAMTVYAHDNYRSGIKYYGGIL